MDDEGKVLYCCVCGALITDKSKAIYITRDPRGRKSSVDLSNVYCSDECKHIDEYVRKGKAWILKKLNK